MYNPSIDYFIGGCVDIDLNALKVAAEAATPGPWLTQDQHDDQGEFLYVGVESIDGTEIIGEETGPGSRDTRFIAAANPAVVLALIGQLVNRSQEVIALHGRLEGEAGKIADLEAEIARLRQRNNEMSWKISPDRMGS